MKQLHPECPCCTCGQIEVTWSDRARYIFFEDHDQVADVVLACALDHSYDSTDTGVPYGLPDDLRDRLAPIIERHMSAVSPDWHKNTAHVSEEQRSALRVDLLDAIVGFKK